LTLLVCPAIEIYNFSLNGRRLINIYGLKKGKKYPPFVEENKKKPRLVGTRCLPYGGKKKH
jgi:hypothetical protein